MIRRIPKRCKIGSCKGVVYAKGVCRNHYWQKKAKEKKEEKKKVKKLSYYSIKKRKENYLYRKLRKKFIDDNPCCQVRLPDCTHCDLDSLTVHHTCGRLGGNFLDTTTWLSVCFSCHRYLHDHDEWARENGYIKSRLEK